MCETDAAGGKCSRLGGDCVRRCGVCVPGAEHQPAVPVLVKPFELAQRRRKASTGIWSTDRLDELGLLRREPTAGLDWQLLRFGRVGSEMHWIPTAPRPWARAALRMPRCRASASIRWCQQTRRTTTTLATRTCRTTSTFGWCFATVSFPGFTRDDFGAEGRRIGRHALPPRHLVQVSHISQRSFAYALIPDSGASRSLESCGPK